MQIYIHGLGTLLVVVSLVVSIFVPIEAVFEVYNVWGGPSPENKKKIFRKVRFIQWLTVILGSIGTLLLF